MDIELIKEILGYAGALGTFVAAWYKDQIANALNIKSKKKEIESSTSDILDQNLEAYQKLFDGYVKRKEEEDIRQIQRISSLETKVGSMEKERENLRRDKAEKEWEVLKLREEIHEIKVMLDKALKQLDYYKKNSDLELPQDLQ